MSEISVIIRSRNEDRWIGHTIQSILDHIKKPQIIVVDNNSSDRTLENINRFKHDPNLKSDISNNFTEINIYNIDDYTPGRALNFGVSKAKNNYILIISSHCVLQKFNKKKHIDDLENYVAIFGNQIPIYEGKKIKKKYIWSHFQEKELVNMYSEMEGRYFFHNALALYEKKFLLENKFDENLLGKEDRYWAKDVIQLGKSILYDPTMSVDHHYTENGNTWKGIG